MWAAAFFNTQKALYDTQFICSFTRRVEAFASTLINPYSMVHVLWNFIGQKPPCSALVKGFYLNLIPFFCWGLIESSFLNTFLLSISISCSSLPIGCDVNASNLKSLAALIIELRWKKRWEIPSLNRWPIMCREVPCEAAAQGLVEHKLPSWSLIWVCVPVDSLLPSTRSQPGSGFVSQWSPVNPVGR